MCYTGGTYNSSTYPGAAFVTPDVTTKKKALYVVAYAYANNLIGDTPALPSVYLDEMNMKLYYKDF